MKKDKEILDLMVDIETLSTDRDKGVVLSVGMQSFTLTSLPVEKDWSLYVTILPQTSLGVGRTKDPETVNWWHQPKMVPAYRRLILDLNRYGLSYYEAWDRVMNELQSLAKDYELRVWSKGIDFDFPMIESSLRDAGLYKRGMELPYKFWNKCDMRTISSMAKRWGWEDPCPSDRVPHSALEDCRIQITQLKSAWAYITSGRIAARGADNIGN